VVSPLGQLGHLQKTRIATPSPRIDFISFFIGKRNNAGSQAA
jgi:hypothetical protein